jgi:hypothetical protein
MTITFCGYNDGPQTTGRDLLAQFGPTLVVDIGFDPNYHGQQAPDLASKGVQALVDSGATESCIDSALAMQLNLPVVDRRTIGGIGGAHQVNMHLGHIHVPALGNVITGAFAAVNLAAGGQQHMALIGRSFLQHFVMVYNGLTGTVAITHSMAELLALANPPDQASNTNPA